MVYFDYTDVLKVKVVIVDSVTFHFRQDFDDLARRTRVLGGMALKLMKLAKQFSLAVMFYVLNYFSLGNDYKYISSPST